MVVLERFVFLSFKGKQLFYEEKLDLFYIGILKIQTILKGSKLSLNVKDYKTKCCL